MNPGTDDVYTLEPGLGGVVVTFFDHHGGPGVEQAAGSMIFANYDYAYETGDFFFTPREMALRIWNVLGALTETGLMPCGRCFAFSREHEPQPSECPKDGCDEDPYVPLWLAFDDLMNSRTDEHGYVNVAPLPYPSQR
jgi:hypothetical protein